MFSKLYNGYHIARESLFYAPALMCVVYAVATILLYMAEHAYISYHAEIPLIYNGNISSAQEIIKTLLSAMITMTTLVISVTMVVLSLSASQLGPRLMKIFMLDNMTKIYVGMFFGSIAACFVLTGILHEVQNEQALPRLTTSAVFLVCFANLFVLLAYVHHVAHLSVADEIITRVYTQLCHSIDRLHGQEAHNPNEKKCDLPKDFDTKAKALSSNHNHYIQTIDYSGLLHIATEHGMVIELSVKSGDYVIHGMVLARIYPEQQATPEVELQIENAFVFGQERTSSQDIEYSVRHMVETALRALSPGINDDFTALTVLNKLAAALARVFSKGIAPHLYIDEEGVLRVVGPTCTEEQLIHNAFSQIRHAGQTKPALLSKIIGLIAALKAQALTSHQTNALNQQLDIISEHINAHFSGTIEGGMLASELKKAQN